MRAQNEPRRARRPLGRAGRRADRRPGRLPRRPRRPEALAAGRIWPQSRGVAARGARRRLAGRRARARRVRRAGRQGDDAARRGDRGRGAPGPRARARGERCAASARRTSASSTPTSASSSESGFDRALVDAPCSGLGVLARRPDLRWRAQPLPELQLELLRAAAERTRPGGTIVYSVCTLNADENEAVVDASGLEVEPLGERVAAVRAPEAAGVPAHDAAPARHVGLLHRAAAEGFVALRSRRCAGATGSRDGRGRAVAVRGRLRAARASRSTQLLDAGVPRLPLRRRRRPLRRADHDGADRPAGDRPIGSTAPARRVDVHLMVEHPAKHFAPFATAGGDSVTFHFEVVDDVASTIARRARARPRGRARVQPGDRARRRRRAPRTASTSCSA